MGNANSLLREIIKVAKPILKNNLFEILREKEEIERKFNVPTFEQMRRERADARLKKDKDLFAALSVFFFVTLLFVVVASPPHR